MIKGLKFYAIFILFSSCTSLLTPEDCLRINVATYNFDLPATLSPALDTFNIGDTITIVSEFPELLRETHTGQERDLIDSKFHPLTHLFKIDEDVSHKSVLDSFDVIIEPQYSYNFTTFSDGEKTLNGQYLYEDGIYKLEYKLVPQKAGLYFHLFASSILDFNPHPSFEDKCSNIPVHANVILNNGEDNNVDFLLNSPDEEMQIYWEQRNLAEGGFSTLGGYCFYVR